MFRFCACAMDPHRTIAPLAFPSQLNSIWRLPLTTDGRDCVRAHLSAGAREHSFPAHPFPQSTSFAFDSLPKLC
jgi:hypothetical protein